MLKIGRTHIKAGVCEVNKDTLTLREREAANCLVFLRDTYTIVRDGQGIEQIAHDRRHGTMDRGLATKIVSTSTSWSSSPYA